MAPIRLLGISRQCSPRTSQEAWEREARAKGRAAAVFAVDMVIAERLMQMGLALTGKKRYTPIPYVGDEDLNKTCSDLDRRSVLASRRRFTAIAWSGGKKLLIDRFK